MTSQPHLHENLSILRRRWWLVALCVAAFLGAAFLWSAQATPLYSVRVPILLNQQRSSEIFDPATDRTYSRTVAMANEVVFATSEIMQLEIAKMFPDGHRVRLSASGNGNANDVLNIRAVGPDPEEVALLAQIWAETLIELRRQQGIEEYLTTASVIQARYDNLQVQLAELPEGPAFERRSLESEASTLRTALNNLTITADLGGGGGARIMWSAKVPTQPFEPDVGRNAMLAGSFGLIFGLALALLIETLDRSVKSRDQLEAITGVPNLSVIPALRNWRNGQETRLVALESIKSPASEAYRTLRAGISFAAIGADVQVLQVTSAQPSEGKSTTAANLAVTFARSGQRVILIDCDLRRPRQHAFFNLASEPGLSTLMVGEASLEDSVELVDGCDDKLLIMPSGPLPPGPAELLGNERFDEMISQLRTIADLIIIDSPPVLPVADALVLSRIADATILVANAQTSNEASIAGAIASLETVEALIIGTVLNQVKKGQLGAYGYGYGYGDAAPIRRGIPDFGRAERRPQRTLGNRIQPDVGATTANGTAHDTTGAVTSPSARMHRRTRGSTRKTTTADAAIMRHKAIALHPQGTAEADGAAIGNGQAASAAQVTDGTAIVSRPSGLARPHGVLPIEEQTTRIFDRNGKSTVGNVSGLDDKVTVIDS